MGISGRTAVGTCLAIAGGVGVARRRSRGRTRRVAAEIAEMDPATQAREILWLVQTRDLAWDMEQALSLALFRTFAVPEVSVVLAGTGAFVDDGQKRYDDTELVLALIGKYGLDVEPGRTALRRMNAMHAAYDLGHEVMAYVLSTFVVEPIRWVERYGWRDITPTEEQAIVAWHLELGRHMGLRDLPTTLAGWDAFNRAYEAANFRYHPDNRAIGDATIRTLLDLHLPTWAQGAGRVVVRALLDEPQLLAAFGYEPAPRSVVRAVSAALRTRAVVQRELLPERRSPYDLTSVARPTYPNGHDPRCLGTFPTAADRAAVEQHRATLVDWQ